MVAGASPDSQRATTGSLASEFIHPGGMTESRSNPSARPHPVHPSPRLETYQPSTINHLPAWGCEKRATPGLLPILVHARRFPSSTPTSSRPLTIFLILRLRLKGRMALK